MEQGISFLPDDTFEPGRSIIDLRSDTVTLPTQAMYRAMASAPLADDALDGDPTARQLEEHTAGLLGKEAGLFMPSCTMANLIAMLILAPRNSRIMGGAGSHIGLTEQGGLSLTGCSFIPVPDPAGVMDARELQRQLASNRSHLRNGMVALETSHNDSGGCVASVSQMRELRDIANKAGTPVHLDGARIFNAATALGVTADVIADQADTVSVCLAKGLSAPIGAVLVGQAAMIATARGYRRMLGGQQRQIGMLAAAGLEALTTMVQRLAEDHERTAAFAEGLRLLAPAIEVSKPQTNIIQVGVASTGATPQDWAARLKGKRILVRPWGATKLRLVLHRHVTDEMVKPALEAFAEVLESCLSHSLTSGQVAPKS